MAYEGMKRNEKRVLELVIYLALIILGGYMTFFNNPMEKEDNMMEQTETVSGTNYLGKELPESENVSADEIYNDNGVESISIYFSNTEKLDQGNLPLEAQSILVTDVQKYLNVMGFDDVTELYLHEESYVESDDKISFICFMDGHKEALQIEYDFDEKCLKYYILPDGVKEENG